jgi:hypothetical protein
MGEKVESKTMLSDGVWLTTYRDRNKNGRQYFKTHDVTFNDQVLYYVTTTASRDSFMVTWLVKSAFKELVEKELVEKELVDNFESYNYEQQRTDCYRGRLGLCTVWDDEDQPDDRWSMWIYVSKLTPIYEIKNNELYQKQCLKHDSTSIICTDCDNSREEKLQMQRVHLDQPIIAVIVQVSPTNARLHNHLNNLICRLEGNLSLNVYPTPHNYSIVFGSPVGRVIVRTVPDNRFYMSYTADEDGKLVGEFTTTLFIPFHEERCSTETLECTPEGPVYRSYYHPDTGSNTLTQQDFQCYLKTRRNIVSTHLPLVLTDLLLTFLLF